MPETFWTVRWPDGQEDQCYSPSSVVADVFTVGARYPLDAFLDHARTALHRASDRVKARYGMPCSAAMAELKRIEARASLFADQDNAVVTCLEIR